MFDWNNEVIALLVIGSIRWLGHIIESILCNTTIAAFLGSVVRPQLHALCCIGQHPASGRESFPCLVPSGALQGIEDSAGRLSTASFGLELSWRVRSGPTLQISDPAPLSLDCQPGRHRRVHCIWLVGRRIVYLDSGGHVFWRHSSEPPSNGRR